MDPKGKFSLKMTPKLNISMLLDPVVLCNEHNDDVKKTKGWAWRKKKKKKKNTTTTNYNDPHTRNKSKKIKRFKMDVWPKREEQDKKEYPLWIWGFKESWKWFRSISLLYMANFSLIFFYYKDTFHILLCWRSLIISCTSQVKICTHPRVNV